jgi:glycosyltransferase involved in cell wall biosynthesis
MKNYNSQERYFDINYHNKIDIKNKKYLGLRKNNIFKKNSKLNPLVSIITVVYNGKKLNKTIKSVLSQGYKNIEYIIINGGDSIKDKKIIERYQNKIDFCINEKDKGIYDAMNKGIKVSTGKYIGFLNCDDFYYKNSINILIKYIRQFPNADFIFGSVKKVKIYHSFHPKKLRWKFNIYPAHSVGFFIKSSTQKKIGLYNTNFKYSADYDLLYRMIVNYGFQGICTKPKEVLGSFATGGFSSKTPFHTQSIEEIKIRLHNKQNLFFIFLIIIKKIIIFLYKKIND